MTFYTIIGISLLVICITSMLVGLSRKLVGLSRKLVGLSRKDTRYDELDFWLAAIFYTSITFLMVWIIVEIVKLIHQIT